MEVYDHAKIQAILNNPDLLGVIWTTVVPDIKDLTAYLDSGKSAKYDRRESLGGELRRAYRPDYVSPHKPNISSREMQQAKGWFVAAFSKTAWSRRPTTTSL